MGLVEEYGADLREEDLKKLLDNRLRFFLNLIVIFPGLFISVAMMYQKVGFSIGPGVVETVIYAAIGLYFVLMIALTFSSIKPMQIQTKLIGEYVQARKLLNEIHKQAEPV